MTTMYSPFGEDYQIVDTDGGYDLVQRVVGVAQPPVKLGHYDTKEAAEKSRTEWKARDAVQDRVEDFIDELIAEHGETLDGDEIRAIISEGVKT